MPRVVVGISDNLLAMANNAPAGVVLRAPVGDDGWRLIHILSLGFFRHTGIQVRIHLADVAVIDNAMRKENRMMIRIMDSLNWHIA
jgi:hypothetical protein